MKFAAGVLPYCPKTQRFLIAKRGPTISNPNQWTNFGGGSKEGENKFDTALREFREESGYKGPVKLIKSIATHNPKDGITFYNYIGLVPNEFKPTMIGKKTKDGNVEVSKVAWIDYNQLLNLNQGILHPGFYRFINNSNEQLQKISRLNMREGISSSLKTLLDRLHENYNLPEGCDEDDLDEMNTTSNIDGGLGQPQTPFAFSKKVKNPDDESYSEPVEHTNRFYKKIEDSYIKLQKRINEINYNDFKSDETRSQKQKINSSIIEINKKLREVEQMINHASKLKLETGADQNVFWKGTLGNFLKINERLIRLSNKIREMNS